MILKLDLLKLPGAETAVLDGIEGVFIPKVPNLQVTTYRRRKHAFFHLWIYPRRGKGKHAYYTTLIVPFKYQDYILACEQYSPRRRIKLGFGEDTKRDKKRSTVVTMTDLKDILGDD